MSGLKRFTVNNSVYVELTSNAVGPEQRHAPLFPLSFILFVSVLLSTFLNKKGGETAAMLVGMKD